LGPVFIRPSVPPTLAADKAARKVFVSIAESCAFKPAQEAESLSVRDKNEKYRRMKKRVCLKPFQKPFKPLTD